MKKLALILLLVMGMILSFSAISLVMLFALQVVGSLDDVRGLILGELSGAESPLQQAGPLVKVQDALKLLQQDKQELQSDLAQLQDAKKTLEEERERLSSEVKDLQTETEASGETQDAERAERLQQLITLYSAMRPADAATIMDRMTDELVLDILPHLQDRQAARILNSLGDDDRKARLSNLLVEGSKKP